MSTKQNKTIIFLSSGRIPPAPEHQRERKNFVEISASETTSQPETKEVFMVLLESITP